MKPNRKLILLAVFASVAVSSLGQGVRASRAQPWQMKQSNPARTGISAGFGANTGAIGWKWRTSGQVPNAAIDRNGRIFLGSTFNQAVWSGDDYVLVLNRDGTPYWRVKVPSYPWGFAQGADSAPALDASSNAVYNAPNANLLRFDEDGDITLQIQGNTGSTNDSAPALLGNGSIFHHQFLSLRKFSAAGVVQFAVFVSSLTDVAVNPSNGESAMGGIRTNEPHGSTDLTYINSDGTIRWRRTSTNGAQANPTFSPEGVVYCNIGSTMAITRDNVTLWAQPNGGVFNPLTLAKNGNVFRFGGSTVQCLNKSNGSIIWSQQINGEPAGAMAVDSRGYLYATTRTGYAVKLDPYTGAILMNSQICSEFTSGPAISNDHSIVAMGKEEFTFFVYKVR